MSASWKPPASALKAYQQARERLRLANERDLQERLAAAWKREADEKRVLAQATIEFARESLRTIEIARAQQLLSPKELDEIEARRRARLKASLLNLFLLDHPETPHTRDPETDEVILESDEDRVLFRLKYL